MVSRGVAERALMAVCFLPARWTRMTRRKSGTDVCVSSQPGLLLQVPLRTQTQLLYETTPFYGT